MKLDLAALFPPLVTRTFCFGKEDIRMPMTAGTLGESAIPGGLPAFVRPLRPIERPRLPRLDGPFS